MFAPFYFTSGRVLSTWFITQLLATSVLCVGVQPFKNAAVNIVSIICAFGVVNDNFTCVSDGSVS